MSLGQRDLLAAREAYTLWAPTYDVENVLSTLDELAVRFLTPSLAGLALLDAACGTARRLVFDGKIRPHRVAGVDLVFEMLLRAREDPRRPATLSVGDVRRLPFPGPAFDVVWCRLAAGHVDDLTAFYRELSRVTRPGGFLIVTDFHPAAAREGHVRSFRDPSGRRCVVEHLIHEASDHVEAAQRCGMDFDARFALPVGPEVRRFYEISDMLGQYEHDRGLPLLLAMRFRR